MSLYTLKSDYNAAPDKFRSFIGVTAAATFIGALLIFTAVYAFPDLLGLSGLIARIVGGIALLALLPAIKKFSLDQILRAWRVFRRTGRNRRYD